MPVGPTDDVVLASSTQSAAADGGDTRQTRQRNARRLVAAANARDTAAQARDVAATARDLAAALRDRKWNARPARSGGLGARATSTTIPVRAAPARRTAAMDRAAAADSRTAAAAERARAAVDREQAARDRARARLDRDALLRQIATAEHDEPLDTDLAESVFLEDSGAALTDDVQAEGGFRELFWRVFGASQNPMLLLDQDRRIAAVNHAQAAVLGHSREEMLGQRLDRFCEPREWEFLDRNWRAFERRGVFGGERRMMRADGTSVGVQYAAQWAQLWGRSIALHVALSTDANPRGIRSLDDGGGDSLSARELEVLGWVALGRRAYEIADQLGIASTTVETHVRSGMRKLGARSRAQFVAVACAQGLLDLSAPPTTT